MEYSYIEKRYNVMGLASIDAFAGINGGMNGNCKDVYFIRMTGANPSFAKDVAHMDETQTNRMRLGQGIYSRAGGFPRNIRADAAARYMGCYQSWLNTGRERLYTIKADEKSGAGELLGASCRKVLEVYHICNPNLNESIEKNFVVKLLYWLDELAFVYLEKWNPKKSMKFVAQGITKEQEYLFCYLLTLLGIDVLLLQNEADIDPRLEALHLSQRIVLGEKQAVTLKAYDSRNPASGEENSGTVSAGGQTRATGEQSLRVVIPPNRRRTAAKADQNPGMAAAGSVRQNEEAAGGTGRSPGTESAGSTGHSEGTAGGTGRGPGTESAGSTGHGEGTAGGSGRSPDAGRWENAAQNLGSAGGCGTGRREGRGGQAAFRTGGSVSGGQGAELAFEELALRASSVVMIAIHDGRGDVIGSGSGIMIGREGYILTNDHVARGGKFYSVRIENDDTAYRTDEIIKYNSLLDLAVIRIDRNLQPLPIYKGPRPLVRGQKVVAIGSPLGLFNSVSDGIISGFRKIRDVDMIQFTAPISHGSSGGAVLNMYGEVIGVSTAGIDEGQNINLAVGYEFINTFVRGFQ